MMQKMDIDPRRRCRRNRWLVTLMIGLPVTVVVLPALLIFGCREWWGYVIQIVWLLFMWGVAFWRGREAERDCLFLEALTEKSESGRVKIKGHHIQWTEDPLLNTHELLMTVPIGEATDTLPFKTEKQIVRVDMSYMDTCVQDKISEYTAGLTGDFERRRVLTEEGDEVHVWVRIA